ncbi:hypothetical protein [Caulobacter sp. RHG1]|uniref:hypothetical protein n=1 Tax=Caulobacter sp. (strain RHG1) TaxID=2545762 RepID=UPI001555C64C|nr:hypothetical protein [Caulobacter sp. RHG1]NQE61461.1 hypothetical protein [Caulobacter sp. RHG1]
MSYSEFSEFSYGFALTHELANLESLAMAPIFPSLLAEGGPGGGWDVNLEMAAAPLYLQFKRSQRIRRASGKEAKLSAEEGYGLVAPYHRFAITDAAKSNQHKMLLELDNGEQDVFYVAPEFTSLAALNTHWRKGEVEDHSVLVRPQEIGALSNGSHSVAFNPEGVWCFSKPKPLTAVSPGALRETLGMRLQIDGRPLRETVFKMAADLKDAERRGRKAIGLRVRDGQQAAFSDALAVSAQDPNGAVVRRVLNDMAQTALGVFDAQLVLFQGVAPKT